MNTLTTGEFITISSVIAGWIGLFFVLRTKYEKEGRWRGRVDTLLESFEKRISNIEKQIADFRDIFVDVFGHRVSKSQSPIRLSDFGESISEEIAAQMWAARISSALKEKITGMDAYEIQVFCFDYVEKTNHYSDEEQRVIREIAYRRGIKVEAVRRVLAIELRDKLLEHAGLEPHTK